ncbi:MAG: undecaprenyl/decaprenyl-phosphate alpha-N-acetylglucosaminyl 1-phosphate transferase, partial [Propionibacterium sp.]|nr:undecaprenyl/decaprenyl-phosphate alpha-N-acetylglucosaminyl 1-phosphate transferase [Propionibacterium sp.]
MREYLLVLIVAMATTYLASGFTRRLALRSGAIAQVRDRDVHVVPIPYFGGIAMLAGVTAAVVVAMQLPFLGRSELVRHDVGSVLLAATVICLVGVLDDIFELGALTKMAGQVLAAALVAQGGVRMLWIPLHDRIIALDTAASIAITVFFIVLC